MGPFFSRYRSEWLAAALLLAGTLTVFSPVLGNDFVNFDDPAYVVNNPNVQAGLTHDSVMWALTDQRASSVWHPLTWISLQLDRHLYGLKPWGFHLTNLLLHAANVLLLFLSLRWLTGAIWRSAAVAALFALHPLHVESVAWVTERKDVLSTFFWMLTLLAYLWYVHRPQRDHYILLLLAFALGLMAKPMLVTLPCVLLLLDWWPLRRFRAADAGTGPAPVPVRRAILEKVPLFLLSAASSVITAVSMSSKGVLASLDHVSLPTRLGNVVVSYGAYLQKMVWPVDLAVFYPLPHQPYSPTQVLAATLVLLTLTGFCLLQARGRPYLLVGWLWYLGTLVPVIGLVQNGSQALADRYTYIPLIGIFLAVVWLADDLVPDRWRRPILVPAAVVVLLLCAWGTWQQVHVWKNSITLWEHSLALTEDTYLARYNLGRALEEAGRKEDALVHYAVAIGCRPDDPIVHFQMGHTYLRLDRLERALASFRKAVELRPQDENYRFMVDQVQQKLADKQAITAAPSASGS